MYSVKSHRLFYEFYRHFICRCDGIGRRSGLKIHRQQWHAGSSPATGTIKGVVYEDYSFFVSPFYPPLQKQSFPY